MPSSRRRPGATPPTEAEVIAWCRERLAHFKCPKRVTFGALAEDQHRQDPEIRTAAAAAIGVACPATSREEQRCASPAARCWPPLPCWRVPARAQTWTPDRRCASSSPIRPGAINDALGRLIGERFQDSLGQPGLVENRPGASGSLALAATAQAAPDGLTIVVANTANLCMNPFLFANTGYDSRKDLTPIAVVARVMNALVVRADEPDPQRGGAGGGGEGEARAAQLRQFRRRQQPASGGRVVQGPHRHRHHPCALSWQRAGAGRPARRPDHPVDRQPAERPAACAGWPAARAGRDRHRARPDACRTCRPSPRPASPVSRSMSGSASSGRRAAGADPRPALGDHHPHRRKPRNGGAYPPRRRHGLDPRAGADGDADRRRAGEMGHGDPHRQLRVE